MLALAHLIDKDNLSEETKGLMIYLTNFVFYQFGTLKIDLLLWIYRFLCRVNVNL